MLRCDIGALAAYEPTITSASHPDLSELADMQLTWRRGPAIDALAEGSQVSCADTLTEPRWPEYAGRALAMGVRSSLTLVHRSGQLGLTLTMYATRPRGSIRSRLPMGRAADRVRRRGDAEHLDLSHGRAHRTPAHRGCRLPRGGRPGEGDLDGQPQLQRQRRHSAGCGRSPRPARSRSRRWRGGSSSHTNSMCAEALV